MITQPKVGEEVGYCRTSMWGLADVGFSKVAKINRWGHITLENGKVFDKNGDERNPSGFSHVYLRDAAELREIQKKNADLKKKANDRATKLAELENMLMSFRPARNDTMKPVTEENREYMIGLIKSL